MFSLEVREAFKNSIKEYTRIVLVEGDPDGIFKDYNLNDLKEEYIEKFYLDGLSKCKNKRTVRKIAKETVEELLKQTIADIQRSKNAWKINSLF